MVAGVSVLVLKLAWNGSSPLRQSDNIHFRVFLGWGLLLVATAAVAMALGGCTATFRAWAQPCFICRGSCGVHDSPAVCKDSTAWAVLPSLVFCSLCLADPALLSWLFVSCCPTGSKAGGCCTPCVGLVHCLWLGFWLGWLARLPENRVQVWLCLAGCQCSAASIGMLRFCDPAFGGCLVAGSLQQ